METSTKAPNDPEPLFDPDKAKRGRVLAVICTTAVLVATLIQTGPDLLSGGSMIAGHLARIAVVVLFGIGAFCGISLGVFLLAIYASLAGTHLCVRVGYGFEEVSSMTLALGATYFIAATVLSIAPSISENVKQRRFRDVQV